MDRLCRAGARIAIRRFSRGRRVAEAARSTLAGRAGIERQYDKVLAGESGQADETVDHRGRTISQRNPAAGRSGARPCADARPGVATGRRNIARRGLARRLETSDDGLPRRRRRGDRNGRSQRRDSGRGQRPRFEPAALADAGLDDANRSKLRRYRADPAHPLFDRTVQMALPPGSAFKTLAAIALLDSPGFDPRQPIDCQGFLHTPDRLRCEIYRRHGVGHGPMTLVDALAQSCNVYFFHYAEEFGPAPLVDWGRRFGFGRLTGIDVPGESGGHLPSPGASRSTRQAWRTGDTASLAIGQGSLTTTPLQVVRMMAAVANGGFLVTPHVASRLEPPASDSAGDPIGDAETGTINATPPRPIRGLELSRLAMVQEGLRRVVADRHGTGYATVRLKGIEIAGKTGTAETGGGLADHAWFAG